MSRLFSGGTDQIDCGTGVGGPTSAMTLSAWFYMTSLAPSVSMIYSRNNFPATSGLHQIGVKSTGKVQYYVGCTGGLNGVDPGSATVSTGQWYHAALTFTAAGGMLTFLNGTSDGTANAGAGSNLDTNFGTQHTFVGFDSQNAGRNPNARIADCALWNVALTSGEISALVGGARPHTIRPLSLLHYLPLDGIQSPEPDLSGNANNGTLTGTASAAGPPTAMFTPRWPMRYETMTPPSALFRKTASRIGTRTGTRQTWAA